MRAIRPWRLALSLAICASGGCNVIFGLSATHQQDAETFEAGEGPGNDASVERVVSITGFTYDNPDGTNLVVDMSPLSAPNIQLGLLSGVDLAAPVMYDAATGVVHVSRDFDFHDWRLVASVDGIPQEWQWQIGDGAHVTSAIVQRNPAQPSEPAGGFFRWSVSQTPPNIVGSFFDVLVTTTGGWKHDRFSATSPPANPTTYDWTPPSGTIAPTKVHDDAEILTSLTKAADIDNTGGPACQDPVAVGYESVDLVGGGPSSASGTVWNTTTQTQWKSPILKGGGSRFMDLLGTRAGTEATWQQAGYVVRGGPPSFDRVARDMRYISSDGNINDFWNIPRGNLRHPPMIDILSCRVANNSGTLSFLAPPPEALLDTRMDKVWYAEMTSSRGSGYGLTSMLQVIATVPVNAPSNQVTLTFATPLAKGIMLDGKTLETGTGSGDGDFLQTVTIGSHRLIPLTWAYEQDSNMILAPTPDDLTINVYGYKLSSMVIKLTPVRAIHVVGTATAAMIDSDALANPGNAYDGFILELVGRNGSNLDKVKVGDYTGIAYPLSQASVFTYAFKVAP